MRIAYVEDNSTNLHLVQRVASMNQHVVVNYTEGEVALNELSYEKFDLILMDVELAGEMNGLQVTRALRARGLTTPIVAVTAYAMMGDREKCLEAGCNEYLPKPLPIAEFLMMLAKYDAQIQAVKDKDAEPEVAAPVQPTDATTPEEAAIPIASIVEPHADPVATNAATFPAAPVDPAAPTKPPKPYVNPAAGSPNVPAHNPVAPTLAPAMQPPTAPPSTSVRTPSTNPKRGQTGSLQNKERAAKPDTGTLNKAPLQAAPTDQASTGQPETTEQAEQPTEKQG